MSTAAARLQEQVQVAELDDARLEAELGLAHPVGADGMSPGGCAVPYGGHQELTKHVQQDEPQGQQAEVSKHEEHAEDEGLVHQRVHEGPE